MSFREKAHWIAILAAVGVWGHYFTRVVVEEPAGAAAFWLFAGSLILVLLVQGVLMVAAALLDPKGLAALNDERDNQIELRGYRFAYYVLTGLVLSAAAMVMLDAPALLLANGVVLAVVVAEISKSVRELLAYRRGVA